MNRPDGTPDPHSPFILDGRFLRAFNGPGMGPMAVYGNFRVNGGLLAGNPEVLTAGDPDGLGMDEDYDACDLENWFLAIQSADGQVVIPSFHRPGILRADPGDPGFPHNPAGRTTPNDWRNTSPDSAARFLRPRAADGHDPSHSPICSPTLRTGRLVFDVDNDGDGVTDSVWLDLGYPPRARLARAALQAAVLLHGHRPQRPDPAQHRRQPRRRGDPTTGPRHAAHLGNSVSEIDPTYALQNAPDPTGMRYTQVDNAGIDVRLTQLRNLLTGTRPQSDPSPPRSTPRMVTRTGS